MKYLETYSDKTKCWWCGSNELTGEHKIKKTELEMLYGKVYPKGNLINHIKYKTESNGRNIQSSTSKRVKFQKNLCKRCNGSKSQKFDTAYQALIEYYYQNRNEVKESKSINLEKVFGDNWFNEYLNVERYIGKHLGCRLAEIGFIPTENLIAFLEGSEENKDLKVLFQIKPYFFGKTDDPMDSIFLGPANPINNSIIKTKGLVTSLSGWCTIANFTWNYLHEQNISNGRRINKVLKIDMVDYSGIDEVSFSLNEETLMRDWSKILDRLEYYPYEHGDKNIEHYKYMKSGKLKN
jgi:uncharacterized membrane protein YcgQ (UPF0703/DUF1980 family)